MSTSLREKGTLDSLGIVYKLVAGGPQSQKDFNLLTNSVDEKEGWRKLISISWFVLYLVMMFGLISRKSLRYQNSTSPKVGCAKPMILFTP